MNSQLEENMEDSKFLSIFILSVELNRLITLITMEFSDNFTEVNLLIWTEKRSMVWSLHGPSMLIYIPVLTPPAGQLVRQFDVTTQHTW